MAEQLETEKAKKAEIIEAQKGETELEKEIAEKKIAELEEKLKDLEEDVDSKDELVNTLAMKERQVNDEVQTAKTTILESKVSFEILEVLC